MQDFLNIIPHRPPFLYVDRVVEQTDDFIRTEKQVRHDEHWIEGHYPGNPIMPGVLICESAFQAGAILVGKRFPPGKGKVPVIARINKTKFKNPVRPGDLLEIEVRFKQKVGPAVFLTGNVKVGSKIVVLVEFTAMFVEDKG